MDSKTLDRHGQDDLATMLHLPQEFEPPQRLLIDATFTLASGKNSGIERVVWNILREARSLADDRESPFHGLPAPEMIVTHGGRFYRADDQYVDDCQRLGAIHANVLASTSPVYRWLARAVCQATRLDCLRKWFLPTAGHLGIFKLFHNWRAAASRRALTRRQAPLVCQLKDLLLLPDAYWINRLRNSVWPAAAQARAEGAFVATVLYDLIPLTHPEFVGEKRRAAFLDYLVKAASTSDLLLTISRTVRNQVVEFLAQLDAKPNELCSDVRPFTLGAALSASAGNVRQHVMDAFATSTPPYLTVATFDPRKNHRYLMDAFDQLWQTNQEVRLCLVGRIGARCDEVVSRIKSHPLLGTRLFLFDDLSDAELQHCYRNARAVVFPSIVEGFGLPIAESLWFGKKTFASDTPIHREVGGSDCEYFSLDDSRSLVQRIVQWESALARSAEVGAPLPIQAARTPVDWRWSTHELLNHCLDAMPAQQADDHPNRMVA